MRIGYIHVDYEEWTIENYNVQEIGLAKAFEELGHETIIVYWVKRNSAKCFTEVQLSSRIKKVYLPGFHLKHHVIFDCNYLKRYQFDLLHIQSDNLFYVPEITAWCRSNKIPYYCYVGTIDSSNPNKIQRTFVNFITKRNIKALKKSRVFVKTPAMAEKLNRLGVDNVKVAPVGLDLSVISNVEGTREEVRKRLALPIDKNIVLCVSALRESRRPMDIFELAKQLDDSYQIVFIGRGPLEVEFKEKLKEYPEIIYINYIANQDIHQYYYCSDYYVNFNDQEIFGMSILEAMYQECTVVARHAPGPDFIIEDGKNGNLCHNVLDMSEIIKSGNKYFEAGKQRILSNFIWDITAKIVLSED